MFNDFFLFIFYYKSKTTLCKNEIRTALRLPIQALLKYTFPKNLGSLPLIMIPLFLEFCHLETSLKFSYFVFVNSIICKKFRFSPLKGIMGVITTRIPFRFNGTQKWKFQGKTCCRKVNLPFTKQIFRFIKLLSHFRFHANLTNNINVKFILCMFEQSKKVWTI